jgi:hypothetical protein
MIQVQWSTNTPAKEWNQAIAGLPGAHILQTWQ